MTECGVGKKYALALLRSALGGGVEEEVLQDLKGLRAVVEADRKIRDFLASPSVAGPKKLAMFESAVAGRVSQLTMKFLSLLVRKRRTEILADVERWYSELLDRERSIIRAEFVTAVPVGEDLKERLQRKLVAMTGERVIIQHEIDPSVLGGAKVIMRDKIIDMTLSHMLWGLEKRLLAAGTL